MAREQQTHAKKCHGGTFMAAITVTVTGLAGSGSCASRSFAAQHPWNAVCWPGSLAIAPILQPSCSLQIAEAYHFIYEVIEYSSVTMVKLAQEWKQSIKRESKPCHSACSSQHLVSWTGRMQPSCFWKLGIFWINFFIYLKKKKKQNQQQKENLHIVKHSQSTVIISP